MSDQGAKDRCWRFHCPECGMGDGEIGELGADHEVWCEVCFSEDGRRVTLRRWLAASDEGASQSRGRPIEVADP